MRVPFLAAFLLPASILFAQGNLDKVRSHRMKNEASIYSEFIAFLQLPNVATDITDIRKNAAFLMDMMKQRGVDNIQLLDAGDQNIPPAVYGDVKVAGATKTLYFMRTTTGSR